MRKLKKKRGLKSYQNGGVRDNTNVSYQPKGSLKAWEKYPREMSRKEAANVFLNEVINPFINFGLASGTPGGGVRTGPELLEGQKAVDYLNSQRAWRPGNRIGTKGEVESINLEGIRGDKYWQKYLTSKDMMGQSNWHSGATDIPANRRAAQMMINKQYGYGKNRPMNNRGIIDRYPISEQSGHPPPGSVDPGNYKTNWEWDISPQEIKKAAGEPRIDYPLEYHQKNQMGGVIKDNQGQWKYPGQVTQIQSPSISMAGVNYPVYGQPNQGPGRIMQPGSSHYFPGASSVTEYPMAGKMAVNKGYSQMGGSIITNDPNDPRLKAYQDSLDLYNSNQEIEKKLRNAGYGEGNPWSLDYQKASNKAIELPKPFGTNKVGDSSLYEVNDLVPWIINPTLGKQLISTEIMPKGTKAFAKNLPTNKVSAWSGKRNSNEGEYVRGDDSQFKGMFSNLFGTDTNTIDLRVTADYSNVKPAQPVVYQAKQESKPISKSSKDKEFIKYFDNPDEYKNAKRARNDSLQLSKQTNYLHTVKGDTFNNKEIHDIIKNNWVYGSDLFDSDRNRQAADNLKRINKKDVSPIWTKVEEHGYPGEDVYKQSFKKPVMIPKLREQQPITREAIPGFGEEQRPYDSIMMPSGQRVTKEQFIKQYGMDTWTKKYGKRQMGGGTGEHLSVFPMMMQLGGDLPPQVNKGLNKRTLRDYFKLQQKQYPFKGFKEDSSLPEWAGAGYYSSDSTMHYPKGAAPKNIEDSVNTMMMELPHAYQLKRDGQKEYNAQSDIDAEVLDDMKIPVGDPYPYNTPGFSEYEAHRQIHPKLVQDFNNYYNMKNPKPSWKKNPDGSITQMQQGGGKWTGPRPWNVRVDKNDSGGLQDGGQPNPQYYHDYNQWKQYRDSIMDLPPFPYPPVKKYEDTLTPEYKEALKHNWYNDSLKMDATGRRRMQLQKKYPDKNLCIPPNCPPPSLKYGGSSDDCFPDPVSFPEERKNDFLKFLRETSFDKVREELDNTMGFEEQEIDMLKKGGHWIQKAVKGMRKDKPCTGAKFGSSSCPAGSKRYNLAKTFKKMNKQYGGEDFPPRQPPMMWNTGEPGEGAGYEVDNRSPFFDPYNNNVPLDVKKLKRRNNSPYNPPWDFIPNTGQKWQPHTDMSWMDTQQARDPNKLDYSPPQGFPQGQSFGLPPKQGAFNLDSDQYNMENVNQRASKASGEGITGRPNWKDRWWADPDLINAGMEGATSFINNLPGGAQDRLKKWQKKTTSADWWSPLTTGSRGDYLTNNGQFRPDDMTPVQFTGAAGFQHYQEGGEVYLGDSEAEQLRNQGYELQEID